MQGGEAGVGVRKREGVSENVQKTLIEVTAV